VHFLVFLAFFSATGCVGSGATLQTATTLAPGKAAIAGGLAVPVTSTFFGEVADTVRAAGRRLGNLDDSEISDAERRQLIEAALAVLTMAPSVIPMVDLRVGAARHFDLGFRYAGPSLGLDGKYQVRATERWNLAVALGAQHHTGIGPSVGAVVYEVIDRAELASYRRQDLRGAFLYSSDEDTTAGFYGAIQYQLAFTRFGLGAVVDRVNMDRYVAIGEQRALLHTIGASSGLRISYWRLALLLELGLAYLHFRPEVLGQTANLSGVIVEPAIALRVRL
jgi:hypothetical protein